MHGARRLEPRSACDNEVEGAGEGFANEDWPLRAPTASLRSMPVSLPPDSPMMLEAGFDPVPTCSTGSSRTG